jgi:hypothetical protein
MSGSLPHQREEEPLRKDKMVMPQLLLPEKDWKCQASHAALFKEHDTGGHHVSQVVHR